MVSSIKVNPYKEAKQYNLGNSIVKGNFPKHENLKGISIFKFTNFLSCVLVLSVLSSMISYSMIISKENALALIHNKTNEVNFDNLELQNKVDYAKSFYNINNKIAKVNFLKKADNILEVKGTNSIPVTVKDKDNVEIKPISGY